MVIWLTHLGEEGLWGGGNLSISSGAYGGILSKA
jgi:hypothetical protein